MESENHDLISVGTTNVSGDIAGIGLEMKQDRREEIWGITVPNIQSSLCRCKRRYQKQVTCLRFQLCNVNRGCDALARRGTVILTRHCYPPPSRTQRCSSGTGSNDPHPGVILLQCDSSDHMETLDGCMSSVSQQGSLVMSSFAL